MKYLMCGEYVDAKADIVLSERQGPLFHHLLLVNENKVYSSIPPLDHPDSSTGSAFRVGFPKVLRLGRRGARAPAHRPCDCGIPTKQQNPRGRLPASLGVSDLPCDHDYGNRVYLLQDNSY